jgi:ankyrin repeat protein
LIGLLVCLTLLSNLIGTKAYSQTNLHPDYQLLVSSLEGDTANVRALLRNGVDPNTPPGPEDKGMTALMFAAWRGHEEIALMLLQAGANPNTTATNGSSPLMYAATSGNPRIIAALLARRANPNYVREDGKIAIMFSILNGHVDAAGSLAPVTRLSLLNSSQYSHGAPLLVAAVKTGNPELVEVLLRANLSLETRESTGQTALMYAVRGGHTRIVTKLLRKGANANARDQRGITSLTKAIVGNRVAVVQVLREYGARR